MLDAFVFLGVYLSVQKNLGSYSFKLSLHIQSYKAFCSQFLAIIYSREKEKHILNFVLCKAVTV